MLYGNWHLMPDIRIYNIIPNGFCAARHSLRHAYLVDFDE